MANKKYISQTDLANFCGCRQPYIAKLKAKGLFDDVLENGKFLAASATKYAKIIEDNRDERREPQRQANNRRKGEDEVEIKPQKPSQKNSDDNCIFDVSYLGDAAQQELDMLLETGKSSVQKIQIKDAFLDSKDKEIEFKKKLRVIIDMEEAEALLELVASNMRTKMYNVAHLFKTKFPKATKEQMDYIYFCVDDAFNEFNAHGFNDFEGETVDE